MAIEDDALWVQFGKKYMEMFQRNEVGRELRLVNRQSRAKAAPSARAEIVQTSTDSLAKAATSRQSKRKRADVDTFAPMIKPKGVSRAAAPASQRKRPPKSKAGDKRASKKGKVVDDRPTTSRLSGDREINVKILESTYDDTVRSIAQEFGVPIEEILELNELRLPGLRASSSFIVGTTVFLPSYVELRQDPSTPTLETSTVPPDDDCRGSASPGRGSSVATSQPVQNGEAKESAALAPLHRDCFLDSMLETLCDEEPKVEEAKNETCLGLGNQSDEPSLQQQSLVTLPATSNDDEVAPVVKTPPRAECSHHAFIFAPTKFTDEKLGEVKNHVWSRDGPRGPGYVSISHHLMRILFVHSWSIFRYYLIGHPLYELLSICVSPEPASSLKNVSSSPTQTEKVEIKSHTSEAARGLDSSVDLLTGRDDDYDDETETPVQESTVPTVTPILTSRDYFAPSSYQPWRYPDEVETQVL